MKHIDVEFYCALERGRKCPRCGFCKSEDKMDVDGNIVPDNVPGFYICPHLEIRIRK